mmetsp:Transcript_44353/g.106567  ORF Transcript_44353/g.106567 Transcript_44353/m.106567 type:complete len:261 (+) Transcript_44353:278-1060(+)
MLAVALRQRAPAAAVRWLPLVERRVRLSGGVGARPEYAEAKDRLIGRDLESDGGQPVRPHVLAQRCPEGGHSARVIAEVPGAEVLYVVEHSRAAVRRELRVVLLDAAVRVLRIDEAKIEGAVPAPCAPLYQLHLIFGQLAALSEGEVAPRQQRHHWADGARVEINEVASHPVPDALKVGGEDECRPTGVATHLDVAAYLMARRAVVGHRRCELAGVLPQPDLLTCRCLDHVLRRLTIEVALPRVVGNARRLDDLLQVGGV